MNYSYYRISLDILETCSHLVLAVKQGDDGRKIRISLTEGSVPYEIEAGCLAVFAAKKPDGNPIYNECAIIDNSIVYEITKQTVASLGNVDCEIKLYDKYGVLITSPSFTLQVKKAVFCEWDFPESAPEYQVFLKVLNQGTHTYQLTENSSLNRLFENGRYYIAGSDQSETIATLLDDAGVSIPETMGARDDVFAGGLFVDVTRQEQDVDIPSGMPGRPCQHMTVYYYEKQGNGCYAFEYDRIHNSGDADEEGKDWGSWCSATHNGLSGAVGLTPNLTIGNIETLVKGSNAWASITGTAENPVLNLGIPGSGTVYASAKGSADFLALLAPVSGEPAENSIYKLTLDTWVTKSDTTFSFSDGGIKVSKAGVVLVSGSVYIKGSSGNTVAVYVYKKDSSGNEVEVASSKAYSVNSGSPGMSPVIIPVAAGDVFTLCAKDWSGSSCIPNAKITHLDIVYL